MIKLLIGIVCGAVLGVVGCVIWFVWFINRKGGIFR